VLRGRPTPKEEATDVRFGSYADIDECIRQGNGDEQPNDLPLSPTAQAFYRSGPTLWQRYTSFWLTSLLNRIAFFVIPVVAALIPVVGFALSIYRWLYIRRLTRPERSTPGQ